MKLALVVTILVRWITVPVVADQENDVGDNKIIGGKPALDGEFPAFVHPVSPGACFYGCGGTLIHPDIVMSAAHCQGIWLEYGTVAIGANTLCATDAEDTLEVEEEYNHPLYTGTNYDNDIALIKLKGVSTVTPAIWNADTNAPADNGLVTACGFGDTRIGDGRTDILLKVTLRTVKSEVCVDQYENLPGLEVNPAVHVCAAAVNKDTCQGDSGGPLFLTGTNVVAGITSYGNDCALPDFAGVYTRVSTYDSWIKKTICQVSVVTPTEFNCDDFCGDGVCDSVGGFEDCVSCSADCGAVCPDFGDGTCDVGESCKISPADCGPCSVVSASCPTGINANGLALALIGASIPYELTVPDGDSISCTLSGGTGDADLKITFGDFSCESKGDGNVEACQTPGAVASTTAIVEVVAFEPFAGVTLTCTCADFIPKCGDGFCTEEVETCETCPSDCGTCPPTFSCKEGINESDLASSELLIFIVTVSEGESVECQTSGGSGDVDLFMELEGNFCASGIEFNDESCSTTIATEDGVVFIVLYPFSPFSDVTLICTCDSNEIPAPSTRPSASPTKQAVGFPFNIPLLGPLLEFVFNIIFFWA